MGMEDLIQEVPEGFDPRAAYVWQFETVDGVVLDQYQPDGKENSWKTLDPDRVVRYSLIPKVPWFPRHDILIDLPAGERFVKRFGRGIMKMKNDGIKLREYIFCCVINKYRHHVLGTSGRTLITKPDFELYI